MIEIPKELDPYYNCNNTCNMQLATKAITTAIKLATLQQNGRSITCTMYTGRPNEHVYSS